MTGWSVRRLDPVHTLVPWSWLVDIVRLNFRTRLTAAKVILRDMIIEIKVVEQPLQPTRVLPHHFGTSIRNALCMICRGAGSGGSFSTEYIQIPAARSCS